jgi:hypothetical protein
MAYPDTTRCSHCDTESPLRELDIAPRPWADNYHTMKYTCPSCGWQGYAVFPVNTDSHKRTR